MWPETSTSSLGALIVVSLRNQCHQLNRRIAINKQSCLVAYRYKKMAWKYILSQSEDSTGVAAINPPGRQHCIFRLGSARLFSSIDWNTFGYSAAYVFSAKCRRHELHAWLTAHSCDRIAGFQRQFPENLLTVEESRGAFSSTCHLLGQRW